MTGIIGRWRVWWRGGVRVVAALSALVLFTVATLAGVIVIYGSRDRAQPADLIVVLGGGTTATPRRALHAVTLYQQGYASHVLCSGGTVSGGLTEAERCAAMLQAHAVDPDAILLDRTSRSTHENAREARAIMARHGWRSAIVVSDDFHLWRAQWLFAMQDITVYPSPAQATTGPLPWREKMTAVLREIVGTGWQLVQPVLDRPVPRF